MTTDTLSHETLVPVWRRWRELREVVARDALIAHYLPYARMLAASLYARRTHADVEFDDYLQWANMGLIESIERFDPDHGVQFKTFASKRVQGAVLNGLSRMTEKGQQIGVIYRLRRERLQSLGARMEGVPSPESGSTQDPAKLFSHLAEVGIGIALGVLLEDTGMFATGDDNPSFAASPEVSYFRKSEIRALQQLLRHNLQRLPDAERCVIQWHYQQEMSFEDIAQRLALTRGRISQLHRKGLLRLRDLLQDGALRDVIA